MSSAAMLLAVQIALGPGATDLERFAAQELSEHLGRLYPGARPRILIGTLKSQPRLARYVDAAKLAKPESFVVTSRDGAGVIAGADDRGVLYGVYALLEKLGYGFYLSYTAQPAPRGRRFDFEAWQLAGAPLVADRIVFNWHNFLSSASTWEQADFERWIAQSARMRFNTVMVHAYGNNPMFTFRYGGRVKPAGYLATTIQGRDWGTQHVNDVRRLHGGFVFGEPVFGASAALVPEERRAEAAQALMKRVFAFARQRGMHVAFALDVDTESSNPQELIRAVPASARITSGKYELANPDTPAGFDYYRSQVTQLLELYPQIDRLVVWFRTGRTPWRDLKPEDFPAEWKAQFEAALERRPELRNDKEAHGMFAIAKIVGAFSRALRELRRNDIELSAGTWNFPHLRAADCFMPPDVKLMALDWSTIFDTEPAQKTWRSLSPERKRTPIVWAHHDDRTYIGRPYTPFAKFASLLRNSGSDGFGIIHWTTRPLDLYFKSLGAQVWDDTPDQPLEAACREMTARTFGEESREAGGRYLLEWITTAPMFGRETSNRFIDVPLKDAPAVMGAARRRLDLLSGVQKGEWAEYYGDFERFVIAFFESHSAWEEARDLGNRGQIEPARKAIARAAPEAVIERYAKMSSRLGISRGEQALVISLNLRWLPYFVSLRQALGLEPIRVRFQATQHEPMAQGAGTNTFHFDQDRRLWKVLGEKETGAPVAPGGCLQIEKPLSLRLGPIMGDALPPGKYQARLQSRDREGAVLPVEAVNGAIELNVQPGLLCDVEIRR